MIERLEACDDDRLAVVARDELVGPAAGDRRDVARTDETVDPHVGRVEDRADRGHDRDVVTEHREVADAQFARAQQRQRRRGRGRLEADREEAHVAIGILLRERNASSGE